MAESPQVIDSRLEERFKLLLIGPSFIGDLPGLYEAKFNESLEFDGGLLDFVDSCSFLELKGSYVEFTETNSEPVGGQLSFGTLEGRLKFLLPSTRTLFYEDLPALYKLVFGETFDVGTDLLEFIESQSYLKIDCFVFVSYNLQAAKVQRPPPGGNPRHKDFLRKRFIYLLRLFPKSPADLKALYKEKFNEDLPVTLSILPAIFKNFLGDYFMVSASNMIYFAPPKEPPVRPQLPQSLLDRIGFDPTNVLGWRLVHIKHSMQLESRYIQFMYYDVYGEPITDFEALKRFIFAAYASPNDNCFNLYERAKVCEPDGKRSHDEIVKDILSKGPMSCDDLTKAWALAFPQLAAVYKEIGRSIPCDWTSIPGVIVSSNTAWLANSSLEYVHKQLWCLVGTATKLGDLPDLFKKTNNYTIPDEYEVREYVLAGADLQIDADGYVRRCQGAPPPSENRQGTPVQGSATASNGSDKLEARQKKNILTLLKKRATRVDKIRAEYQARFGEPLQVSAKLMAWLQAIEGVHVDFKTQIVSSGLNVAQVKVITVLLECKEINFEAIPAECKKRFGGDLGYPGQLKAWLCNIPGLVISPSKMCTYNQTGGSMLDLSGNKLKSNLSKSTPDMRPRSKEEQAASIIVAHPNSTLNEFLQLYQGQYGKKLQYDGKLKSWLETIPGVCVNSSDRINMQAKDVATNAKQNIEDILKHKNWVHVDEFATLYKELFGCSASQTWIQGRQKEIEFLMLLNNKVRYEILSPKLCLQYVKHMANLCNGLTVHQVKLYFPAVYGFTLPESRYTLVVQAYPTGKVEAGQPTNIQVEILDDLKTLSWSQRRALLYLMHKKSWIRIEDLFRETYITVPSNLTESAFCESIPNVMMKNSRVKFQRFSNNVLMNSLQKIVTWMKFVQVTDLPSLVLRLFGFRVQAENLPLEELKLSSTVEPLLGGAYLRSRACPQLWVSTSDMAVLIDALEEHSNLQLHRLFRLVAANSGIELGKLETLYRDSFGVPIMAVSSSFKLYIDGHPEFSVSNAKVTLAVPLSQALKEPPKSSTADTAKNLLSAEVKPNKPTQISKYNPTENPGAVRPTTLEPKIINYSNDQGSDSLSEENNTSASPDICHSSNLKEAEIAFFDSVIGDKEKELKVLCNDYKNKFKTPISVEKLEQLLLAAGHCCSAGRVHRGCKERLLFLLSARKLDQTEVILVFKDLFSRSPCYPATNLRKHLMSIGCRESPTKHFYFPLERRSADVAEGGMIERLLPIIGYRNKTVHLLDVLEEYNNRHDPPLTPETLQDELKKLSFVMLSKSKKSFDFGGIHESSVKAMKDYLRKNENTLSVLDLARELPARTGAELIYFGNLVKALQSAGFNVSNDVVTSKEPPVASARETTPEDDLDLRAAVDLTEIRSVVRDLVRQDWPIAYDDLEQKFKKAIGYNLNYDLLGCSSFPSFLRLYLPDEGMTFEEDTVSILETSDLSRNSSRTSPAHSSEQACFSVFDVLNVCGPLLYPSELQAKYAELTGGVLRISDPDAYLAQLLRATELTVRSDGRGRIRVSKTPFCECEEEMYRSGEEDSLLTEVL